MTFFLCVTDLPEEELLIDIGVGAGGEALAGDSWEDIADVWPSVFYKRRFPPPDVLFPLVAGDVGFGVCTPESNFVSAPKILPAALPVLFRLLSDPRVEKGVFGQHEEDSAAIAYWGFGDGLRLMQYSTEIRERYGAFGPPRPGFGIEDIWERLTIGLDERGIEYSVDEDPVVNLQPLEPMAGKDSGPYWRKYLTRFASMEGAINGTLWLDSPDIETTEEFAEFLAVEPLEFESETLIWREAQQRQVAGTFRLSRRNRKAFVNRIVVMTGNERRTVWERESALDTLSSIDLQEAPQRRYERWSP